MVYICDAMCGQGKTTAAINMMKENAEETRYLYITPFLEEVSRIKKECAGFMEPSNYGSKLDGIKYLLNKSKNIVSTHALFHRFDEECIDLTLAGNYTLVMDEVANVVEGVNISEDDMRTLLEKYVTIADDGKVIWTYREYVGDFDKYKKMADLETLYYYGKNLFVWMFPVSIFKAFRDVYILTYIFKAQIQCNYYDFYKVQYKNIYVEGKFPDCRFTEDRVEYGERDYKELISIVDNPKLNAIGDADNSLSVNWYKRNEFNINLKKLKSNLRTFFDKTKSQDNLWTTFKDFKEKMKGRFYTKGYIAVNARATNEFRHKSNLAYTVNIFMKPDIKQFFRNGGVAVDEDAYALSELIQWMFRSAIRDRNPITIYIPSRRMRTLLQTWIDG